MTTRTTRAKKLLTVETMRVGVRERELAAAERAHAASERVVAERVEALAKASDAAGEATSSEDLARASAHIRTLEARVASARADAGLRRDEVKQRQVVTIAARVGERRMEMLVEGFERAEVERARKVERRTADEHAARKKDYVG